MERVWTKNGEFRQRMGRGNAVLGKSRVIMAYNNGPNAKLRKLGSMERYRARYIL